jgi:hypothetical protein
MKRIVNATRNGKPKYFSEYPLIPEIFMNLVTENEMDDIPTLIWYSLQINDQVDF